jgi:hypothetical protein
VATRRVRNAEVGDPASRLGWLVISSGDRLRGGGFKGDFVSEGFEFADEPAFAGVGVIDAAGEVVRAKVAVGALLLWRGGRKRHDRLSRIRQRT